MKKVTRTEMFIHSEMNRDGGQGSAENRRWDGAGDYRSNGCVKLAPARHREDVPPPQPHRLADPPEGGLLSQGPYDG